MRMPILAWLGIFLNMYNYQLFMEREETTELVPINEEQNATKDTNNEELENIDE